MAGSSPAMTSGRFGIASHALAMTSYLVAAHIAAVNVYVPVARAKSI